MPHLRTVLVPFTAILFGAGLGAQDLLGVRWTGAVVRIDSHTAAVVPLGMGLQGQNGLARTADGTYWSTRRVSTTNHSFTRIDPVTGSATVAGPAGDLRGLAMGPGDTLYAVRDGANSDVLVRVQPATGFTTTIGNLGTSDVQGLTMHQGSLYAWDVFLGLMVVDPATGAAVDPFPAIGGPAYQQSLCSHPDGRLLLGGGDSNGNDQLFEVDVATGATTLIGTMPSMLDVRGIEPIGGFASPFGRGCAGAGGPVFLGATGSLHPGGQLTTRSTNHAPNAFGIVICGFSDTVHGTTPLPAPLDPLLGTNGCSLFVSIDAHLSVASGAGNPATMDWTLTLPSWSSGLVLRFQHACFEPVLGGSSWSNGLTVRIE